MSGSETTSSTTIKEESSSAELEAPIEVSFPPDVINRISVLRQLGEKVDWSLITNRYTPPSNIAQYIESK